MAKCYVEEHCVYDYEHITERVKAFQQALANKTTTLSACGVEVNCEG